ncbi:MAG: hypothetical protein CK548_06490 [Opitutia bacterium]|nr:phosphodiester glycosidase family protein [Opitutaceae bacterium]PHX71540.1 MAG: hypothetical protein CK548_06490 [Opitutae bacterium]
MELATGETDKAEARLQKVVAIRVDLRAPGIECFTTPSNGDRPLETTSETTVEFLTHHGLQVAINANFFPPCCSPGEKDLTGVAISRGQLVSTQEARHNGSGVLLITIENRAAITVMNNTPIPTEGVWTAISGSAVVLAEGKKPTGVAKDFCTLAHPRSAVGLSQDRRYLVLLTIEGRQSGYSDGATMAEVADWLQRFGAHDGINLDGGGSTTLVRAESGQAVVLNRPSGVSLGSGGAPGSAAQIRGLRSNGSNFGIFAPPLPLPVAPRTGS